MGKTQEKLAVEEESWWECSCKFKNAVHLKFCGQCGSAKPTQADPSIPLVRLDLGCGSNKRKNDDGRGEWVGVDAIAFDGVDVVMDLCEKVYTPTPYPWYEGQPNTAIAQQYIVREHTGYKPWPWADNSVDEIHCAHFIEHFGGWDRVHIFNEVYRVLKPGAKATFQAPCWKSGRAYGDPTHAWPPVADFMLHYLRRDWRLGGTEEVKDPQAPHTDAGHVPFGYDCDFDFQPSYTLSPTVGSTQSDANLKTDERKAFEATHYLEVAMDIIFVATKRPKTW